MNSLPVNISPAPIALLATGATVVVVLDNPVSTPIRPMVLGKYLLPAVRVATQKAVTIAPTA